jgi:hypothetical protein
VQNGIDEIQPVIGCRNAFNYKSLRNDADRIRRILSALTTKTRCRKLEPGICAWLQRVIIKGIRISDILRKPFNSSEFILKIAN